MKILLKQMFFLFIYISYVNVKLIIDYSLPNKKKIIYICTYYLIFLRLIFET